MSISVHSYDHQWNGCHSMFRAFSSITIFVLHLASSQPFSCKCVRKLFFPFRITYDFAADFFVRTPSDARWPSKSTWTSFNSLLQG